MTPLNIKTKNTEKSGSHLGEVLRSEDGLRSGSSKPHGQEELVFKQFYEAHYLP